MDYKEFEHSEIVWAKLFKTKNDKIKYINPHIMGDEVEYEWGLGYFYLY